MRVLSNILLVALLSLVSVAGAQPAEQELRLAVIEGDGDQGALQTALDRLQGDASACIPEGAASGWGARIVLTRGGDMVFVGAALDDAPAACLRRLFSRVRSRLRRLPGDSALVEVRARPRDAMGQLDAYAGDRNSSRGSMGWLGTPGGGRARRPEPVRGRLSREAIQQVVRVNLPEVRACYEAGLERQPELAGRVVVHFVIAANGAIDSAEVREDGLGDGAVAECIVADIRGWHFPEPEGHGVVGVTYPFVLRLPTPNDVATEGRPDDEPAPPSTMASAAAANGPATTTSRRTRSGGIETTLHLDVSGRSEVTRLGHGRAISRVQARIRLGRIDVEGETRSAASIRAVAAESMPRISRCYEHAIREDADFPARIALRFSIDAEGRVSDARVRWPELDEEGIGPCLVGTVWRWRFREGAPATVTMPLAYRGPR